VLPEEGGFVEMVSRPVESAQQQQKQHKQKPAAASSSNAGIQLQ